MKVVTTALALLCLYFSTAQKTKLPKKECSEVVKRFELGFPVPTNQSYISMHYGMNKIGACNYFNEGITFATFKNSAVFCNVDTAFVKGIYADEGVYTVFLQKDEFIVVLDNLKNIKVKNGETILQGKSIGTVEIDESNNDRGMIELMLFQNKKIVNPELYLKPVDNGTAAIYNNIPFVFTM